MIGALGQNTDVYSAVDYVNQSGAIPKNIIIHPDTVTCMRKISASQGWTEPPEGFTVSPVNSPAALEMSGSVVVTVATYSTRRISCRWAC